MSQTDRLCERLRCGKGVEFSKDEANSKPQNMMMIDCSKIQNFTSIWQCITKEEKKCQKLKVTCTGNSHARITHTHTF